MYNKQLAIDTNNKISSNNTEIRTIHSFSQKAYNILCGDEQGLKNVLKNNSNYMINSYDIVIIDEAQDLTPLLFSVVKKIIYDTKAKNVMFMGDRRQCIYGFKEADNRFLTHADQLLGNICNNIWIRCTLSTTYRCTNTIVDFINHCMLSEKRMTSNIRNVNKPIYICCNPFKIKENINRIIDTFIRNGNTYEDIAILSNTLGKGKKTPIIETVNYLSDMGKPIYMAQEDHKELNDILIKNKIIISTIHQFKGLEKKLIIVFGFDAGFYKSEMCKGESDKECPNLLYVAATRAKEKLILILTFTQGECTDHYHF